MNKKISVFSVTGLKILGRELGTHIFFFKKLFLGKNNFMHFERQIHKIIFCPKNLKNLGFMGKFK